MKKFLNERELNDISTKGSCDQATIILQIRSNYANLIKAGLEKNIFENTNFKPLSWLRYLDDIFCTCIEGLETL